jgi:hypothetical protein
MPAVQGQAPGSAFDNTNSSLRKEVKDDIADALTSIDDVKRTADSIVVSDNFHLDSKLVNNQWKVEIQYRKGTKGTVAVVLVDPNATSIADLKQAIKGSVSDGNIWLVT